MIPQRPVLRATEQDAISIGSRRTLPGSPTSLPCAMSRMTWSTSASGDIFALLTVTRSRSIDQRWQSSTTRMPTSRNCRRSAIVKERRPALVAE